MMQTVLIWTSEEMISARNQKKAIQLLNNMDYVCQADEYSETPNERDYTRSPQNRTPALTNLFTLIDLSPGRPWLRSIGSLKSRSEARRLEAGGCSLP